MNNFLSVIVPVYKNTETVLYLLNEINKQTLQRNLFEVIIVDDFSLENINKTILKKRNDFKFDFKIFRNKENRGVAYTRNQGIRKSKGSIVLFLGGDIIPDKNLFFVHFENHKKHHEENVAILGYVTWSPKIKITPFMKWLDSGGPQNSFYEIEDKKWVSDKYFYGSNISLKKTFFEKNGFFNENFKKYGFEDFELGHRLSSRGLKILYLKKAIGYHHHKISLNNVLKREDEAGQNAVLLDKIYPKLGFTRPYFIFYKKIARKIVFNRIVTFFTLRLANFYENKKIYPRLYARIVSLYFFRGVKNGLNFHGFAPTPILQFFKNNNLKKISKSWREGEVFAIVVNYNQKETTKKCIESLLKEAPEIKIFIIDNGSTDGSFTFLGEFFKTENVEIIKSRKNLGFGAGANIGIKKALLRGADFVLILNNDTIFEHNFLKPLLKEIKKEEKIGITCPKINFLDNKNRIWYLGGKIDFLRLKVLHNFKNKEDPFETDFASGCAMMVKKEVFGKIGFFKEKYFMFFEDADFSNRVKKAGFKIIAVPLSKIYHKESLTIKKSPLKTYYLVRNGLLFGQENYSPFLMPWLYCNFFIRFVFNFGKNFFNPQNEGIKAVSEGLSDFIKKRWGQK